MFNEMNTVSKVLDYISMHHEKFGFYPAAVGLPYDNYIRVMKEMGGDGRCTNLKAHINGVPLVRV